MIRLFLEFVKMCNWILLLFIFCVFMNIVVLFFLYSLFYLTFVSSVVLFCAIVWKFSRENFFVVIGVLIVFVIILGVLVVIILGIFFMLVLLVVICLKFIFLVSLFLI